MGIERKRAYRFEYLKSQDWKTVRAAALHRDGYACKLCDKFSKSNDAHHIDYPPDVWDTMPEHLITLCRECHDVVHVFARDVEKYPSSKKKTTRLKLELALKQAINAVQSRRRRQERVNKIPKECVLISPIGKCGLCWNESIDLMCLSSCGPPHAPSFLRELGACEACRIHYKQHFGSEKKFLGCHESRAYLKDRLKNRLTKPKAKSIDSIVSCILFPQDDKPTRTENSAIEPIIVTQIGGLFQALIGVSHSAE